MLGTGTAPGAVLAAILILVERSWVGSSLAIDARFGVVALATLTVAVVGAISVALRRGLRGAAMDMLR